MTRRFLKTQDELPHEKTICILRNYGADHFVVTAKQISPLVFTTGTVKFPYLLTSKTSYYLVFSVAARVQFVGSGRDPKLLVLTREGSDVAYFSPLYGIYLHLFCRLTTVVCWIFAGYFFVNVRPFPSQKN